ncbi:hypothetical protein L218DRAFT_992838 [Marasmius fiardii PR-910]|nr:hypothetical protein L218DRAFT_992838 [Marasmius fiardii PR-910]
MFPRTTTFFTLVVIFFTAQVIASPLPMPMRMMRRQLAPLDTIPAYVKRQINNVPVQEPTKSDGTKIELYGRQDLNETPEETPTASDGNGIKLYRRQDTNNAPVDKATKSDGNGHQV